MIDVPAQLTLMCLLESFIQLVAPDVIPGQFSTSVPLGSGSFKESQAYASPSGMTGWTKN